MDFTSFYMYLFVLIMMIVCVFAALLMMIIGIVKKKKKLLFSSFIPIVVFLISGFGVSYIDKSAKEKFEQIPCLELVDNTVTILNESTGQKGIGSKYILAEEGSDGTITVMGNEQSKKSEGNFYNAVSGILSQTDNMIYYKNHGNVKYGYKFTANKPGTAYVCVLKEEFSNPVFVEIYKVVADNELNVLVADQKEIKCDDDFEKNLPEEFAFITKMVKSA